MFFNAGDADFVANRVTAKQLSDLMSGVGGVPIPVMHQGLPAGALSLLCMMILVRRGASLSILKGIKDDGACRVS